MWGSFPENRVLASEKTRIFASANSVRFDLKDYSVPHIHVRRTLAVVADEQRVRIFDGTAELATHARSYDAGAQIEDAAHIAALIERKHLAHAHRGVDRLARAAPASAALLAGAAERGNNLGTITAALLRMLDRYSAAALEAAIGSALAQGVPHPNAVQLALERAREEQGLPPPTALHLSAEVARRDAPVRSHALASRDRVNPNVDGEAHDE